MNRERFSVPGPPRVAGKVLSWQGRLDFPAWLNTLSQRHRPVVATVAMKGGGLTAEAKARSDVRLAEVEGWGEAAAGLSARGKGPWAFQGRTTSHSHTPPRPAAANALPSGEKATPGHPRPGP